VAQNTYDVLIIGEGVSGLTTANALAKSGLKTATLEAQLFGGLIINVNELEPAPESRTVSGAEFASELMQANADLGVTSIQEAVTSLTNSGGLKQVVTGAATYQARHVVLASGARLRKLGIPGETEFEGRGVSQCADCDGPMYQNEDAVVVGGGDSALQEALVLARFCRKVHIVHRGRQFHAHSHFVDQVAANGRISTVWNATVEAVNGSKMVEKVRIKHAAGHAEEIPCAGLFAYVGLVPNAEFLPPEITRDAAGFVITRETLETELPGVWAVGALRSGYGGLLSDAIAEAGRAAQAIRAKIT
jgi:thioredoxin reductase (NADPH)